MQHTVYCLADPRAPHIMRYVGRTSAHYKKRLSDHIAAAKFHPPEKHNAVMRWLAELDSEGIRAVSSPLGIYDSDVVAEQVEAYFIDAHRGLLLNDPRAHTRGGRPVGSTDSPAAIRRKKEAWQREGGKRQRIAAQKEASIRRRAEMGYPHPELYASHPLNDDHRRARLNKPPRKRNWSATASASAKASRLLQFHDWRVAIGCPHPELSVFHIDNKEWKVKADADGTYICYDDWLAARSLLEGAIILVPESRKLG